jgi:hypothetical protein
MADKPTSPEMQKLFESAASLELDTDLRLHPQKLELGKAELLTDALTLPFVDIENRLAKYTTGVDTIEKDALRRSMKSYLARLNSNPLIPLHFRLKVLTRFEKELDLFDAEMTAAVLNAHKIGVDMVQKAARSQPSYYRILVDMVASAIDLAVKLLRLSLEKYQAPAVIATRQVFDLMRLGLSIVPLLTDEALAERERVYHSICTHEMLRMLDFFGKSHADQKMTWQELQHHIVVLKPILCRQDGPIPEIPDHSVMVTSLSRPNDPGKVVSKIPTPLASDCIAIPMDKFIDRLVTAVNRVENVMRSADSQMSDLFTEEALHTTLVGGNAILNAVRTKPRGLERKDYTGTRVVLEWNPRKSFVEAFTNLVASDYEYAPTSGIGEESWMVANVSLSGVGLERPNGKPLPLGVNSIIGMNWLPHRNEPMLGFIRWIKEPKPGEQRMGIEFFGSDFRLFKGTMLGANTEDKEMTESRSWPVLVKPGKKFHTVFFPDNKIFRTMTFMLAQEGKSSYFKVIEVVKTGPNYSLCKVVPASMEKSKQIDFSTSSGVFKP